MFTLREENTEILISKSHEYNFNDRPLPETDFLAKEITENLISSSSDCSYLVYDQGSEPSISADDNNEPEHDSHLELIFSNSNLSIGAFYLLIALFIGRFNLSDASAKALLKIFAFVLPQPNRISTKISNVKFSNGLDYEKEIFCGLCSKKIT